MIKKSTLYIILPLFVIVMITRRIPPIKTVSSQPITEYQSHTIGMNKLLPGSYRVLKKISQTPIGNTEEIVLKLEDVSDGQGDTLQVRWIQPTNHPDEFPVGSYFDKKSDGSTFAREK